MKRPAIAFLCSLALAAPGLADTFILKDGTKLEGKILSEDADSYTLVIQVTKSIKDERKISKADVAKIERERPDDKAFEAIAKLVPAADLMDATDYSMNIASVKRFLKTYSDSAHAKKAREILATLEKESKQIEAGSIKVGGVMISPEAYQANAVEFDANLAEAKIRNLVEQRQLLGALRAYDSFAKDFSNTIAFSNVVPLMTKVIQTYVGEAKQALSTFEDRTKKREIGLEQMSADDRAVSQRAIADENAAIQSRFEAEKADATVHWVTTNPFCKPALEEAVRYGESELQRLSDRKSTLEKNAATAYREAWAMIHNGSADSAISSAITDAKSAGVPARYIERLEAAKPKKQQ